MKKGENFDHNIKLVELISQIGEQHHVTPVQIALAWLLRQGDDIVPIPGTRHIRYLDENAKACDVKLPESAWQQITDLLTAFQVQGERYPEKILKLLDNFD
jgi:aryl-alcohol dehydrogenase-like predicted oxidoreductase